jgi:LCP family protein required for cell wall assembly
MSAFDRVHSVSTPPPEISGAALGGDEDMTIDTGPAQEALREHEAAEHRATESGGQGESLSTEPAIVPPTDSSGVVSPTDSGDDAPASTTGVTGDPGGTEGPSAPDATQGPPPQTVVDESSVLAHAPAPDEGAGESINILLMGVDSRDGEAIDIGVRPDSLGILNLNEATGTCRILAVPRDSRVEVPGYGQSKVNHALAVGGIPFEQLVLEEYLDIEIDHYALVDFSGLVAVVDAVGGVTIDNPEAFQAGGHTFAAGTLELDGEEALAYARYRGGQDGDFGRVEKQQRIMRALVDEAGDANLVRLVPDMFTLLQDHFRTDFGVMDLLDLANTYRDTCTSGTLETNTIPGDVATMFDDMMQMDLSFVVSDPADTATHVEWLLTGELGETADTPDQATPPATPAATPAASTTREWTPSSRWTRNQAQG